MENVHPMRYNWAVLMLLGEVQILYLSDLCKRRPTVGRALAMMRGIRAFSPHQQKTGALNSETPCETEETAPPWEQNRNILSFSESFRKVEVLYSEGGTFNLLSDW